MNALRYALLGASFLLAGLALWGTIHARSEGSAQKQANDGATAGCIDCAPRLIVPQDPGELAALTTRVAQKQAALDAAASEENRLRVARWKGCRFTPTAKSDNADVHARQSAAADLLFAKQQVPECRLEAFRWATGNRDIVLVGWNASISSVVEIAGGKRIELEVAPELATKAGGIAITPHRCKETWKIDQSGGLTVEKIEPVAGTRRLILTL
jgi:hypothetical protein